MITYVFVYLNMLITRYLIFYYWLSGPQVAELPIYESYLIDPRSHG